MADESSCRGIIVHLSAENDRVPLSIISTLKKIKSGYLHGTRVVLGNLEDFLSTSCVSNLTFLANIEDGEPENLNPSVRLYLEHELSRPFFIRRVGTVPQRKELHVC